MRNVDEIGFFGLNAGGHFERLPHAQMSRVRLLPQRIDDQTFNAENRLRDFIRHGAAITEISDDLACVLEHGALPCAPSGQFVRSLRKYAFISDLRASVLNLSWVNVMQLDVTYNVAC